LKWFETGCVAIIHQPNEDLDTIKITISDKHHRKNTDEDSDWLENARRPFR